MFRYSIRLRLLLWFGFLLALLVAGFGTTAYQLQKNAMMEELDAELAKRADLVSVAFRNTEIEKRFHPFEHGMLPPDFRGRPYPMGPPPDGFPRVRLLRTPVTLPESVTNLFTASNGCFFAVWEAGGSQLAQSASLPESIERPKPSDAGTAIRHHTRGTWREAYHFTEMRDCVLVGCDIAADLARLRNYAWGLAGTGGLVLLLGLGGGWFFAGLSLRSIWHIGATARRISEGSLSERIPTAHMDRELGQLADVLNATFARLDAAFSRQQQFTADAAHELRTPLAVIISEAQTVLRRDRSAEEYRDTIRSCEETAQKMRRLSDSLLELARLDAGPDQGARAPVDLADIAQQCVAQLQPLAAQREIQFQLDLKPATLTCQPEQIGRVFTNLLVNAMDYNHPGGSIRVCTATEAEQIVATLADTGEGIPAEDLPHIFDRFYRSSRSRSRAGGHAGLGLAICKAIVEAHGGQIGASSVPGASTSITLSWPSTSAQG
jgi:two-component system, OmpR family, sensor kinase